MSTLHSRGALQDEDEVDEDEGWAEGRKEEGGRRVEGRKGWRQRSRGQERVLGETQCLLSQRMARTDALLSSRMARTGAHKT
eukprot:1645789-Rhodomonas_salina.2